MRRSRWTSRSVWGLGSLMAVLAAGAIALAATDDSSGKPSAGKASASKADAASKAELAKAKKSLATKANSHGIPQVELINEKIREGWASHQLTPSLPATDGEWVRRLYLDLLGRIPTVEECGRFVADRAPDKKLQLVNSLLGDDEKAIEEYARNWTTIWTNVLIGRAGGGEQDRNDEPRRPAASPASIVQAQHALRSNGDQVGFGHRREQAGRREVSTASRIS